MPWNAETGFMEPPAGDNSAASTPLAQLPIPGGGGNAAAPTPLAQLPIGGGSQVAPTPFGQGAGQGGGMSPLLMMLLQGQGGLFSNFSPAGMGMNPLMAYFMAQQGGQPGGLGSFGGFGGGAASVPLGQLPLPGANQQPPPDPLTAQQRAFMGYGGQGQPPNWAAATGNPDPTGGWSPNYQPQTPQQNFTPQDFVSQWQQMFGRT